MPQPGAAGLARRLHPPSVSSGAATRRTSGAVGGWSCAGWQVRIAWPNRSPSFPVPSCTTMSSVSSDGCSAS